MILGVMNGWESQRSLKMESSRCCGEVIVVAWMLQKGPYLNIHLCHSTKQLANRFIDQVGSVLGVDVN